MEETIFCKFYLDKEKDIIVRCYKINEDEIEYVIETPNHQTGNLITNFAKIINMKTVDNENGKKVIKGRIEAVINDNNQEVYILRLGGIKIANIYPDGRYERKAKIPSIMKILMAQTKNYKYSVEKTIVKSYISKKAKFRTDLHTHLNQILQPDLLIALGIKHQMQYSLYYIKKLGIVLTDSQEKNIMKRRKAIEKKYADSELTGKYLERKINDETFINMADLILNNIENSEENIVKIRNSLVLLKDGQAVFSNLEKCLLYRYAIIRGNVSPKNEQIKLDIDKINQISDKDIRENLLKMLEDQNEDSEYKNNSFYQDKLLWIAREYKKQGIQYVEIANSTLAKKGSAGIYHLSQMHEIMPKIEKETGVSIRYLAAASRTLFTEEQLQECPFVIKALSKSPYVVGMDLIGEEINNVTDFSDIIGEIIKYSIYEDKGFTIRLHAGETDGFKDNIEKALDCVKICVPNGEKAPNFRIGHGLYVPSLTSKEGKRIIEKMKDLNAVLEFQLSSNVRLNNLNKLENHPIKDYLNAGIKCVQGTDGCGFYGIDAIDEQIALRNVLCVSDEEFLEMKKTEIELLEQKREYFIEKQKKFEEFLNGRTVEQALEEEINKCLQQVELNQIDTKGVNIFNSYDVFNEKIVTLPVDKTPIVIAGGSFNSQGRHTVLDVNIKDKLRKLLEEIDENNNYILIGHKMQGYERAVLDISKELNKNFNVTAVVPKYVSEDVKERLDDDLGLTGIYVSPDPSEFGIYKSFNYEIFERKKSVLIVFDGNTPALNLVQEAKNGKADAKIYINTEIDNLSQKAEFLEGYVSTFEKDDDIVSKIINENPELV